MTLLQMNLGLELLLALWEILPPFFRGFLLTVLWEDLPMNSDCLLAKLIGVLDNFVMAALLVELGHCFAFLVFLIQS